MHKITIIDKRYFKTNNAIYKIMFILSCVAVAYCFLTLYYVDLILIAEYGYEYADHVLTGRIVEFLNNATWSYGISLFTIFAIWSIPVWLYFKLFNIPVDLNQTGVYLWYKLLVLLFVIWSVYIVARIAGEVYPKFKRMIVLNYLSSTLLVFPAIAICQCDIIGLCFVLLGIFYFMRNNTRAFLISFAIACTMKYFALFVFLPLLLLKFKKIKQIICGAFAGGSLIFVSLIIQSFSEVGGNYLQDPEGDLNKFYITALSNFSLERGDGGDLIGMLGVALAIVLIMAYLTHIENDQERKKYAIWYATAGYFVFFLNYPANTYWFCLIAPLMLLLAYTNINNIGLNLILEVIYALSVFISKIYIQKHVLFGSKAYSYLLLKRYANTIPEDINMITKVIDRICPFDFTKILPTIIGIGFACAIMFMIINFPASERFIVRRLLKSEDEENKEILVISGMRILILYIWIGISIITLLKYN